MTDGYRGVHLAPTYRHVLRTGSSAGWSSPRSPASWGDNIARVALASLVLARTDSAFLAVLAFVVELRARGVRVGAARRGSPTGCRARWC